MDWTRGLDVISRWSIEWPLTLKQNFVEWLNKSTGRDILAHYSQRLKLVLPFLTLDGQHSEELLTSGAFCFYGAALLSYSDTGSVNNINACFAFTALYLAIDHYIDDPANKEQDKVKLMEAVKSVLYYKTPNVDKEDVRIIVVCIILCLLLIYQPDSIQYMRAIFKAEADSFKIQRKTTMTEKQYMYAAKHKGGATVQALQALVSKPTSDGYKLGQVIQLVDDIIDVDFDLRDNINTIATYQYHKKGHIDELIIETLVEINALNARYNVFKVILVQLILYALTRKDYLSKHVIKVEKYTLFEYKGVTPALILFNRWMKNSLNGNVKDKPPVNKILLRRPHTEDDKAFASWTENKEIQKLWGYQYHNDQAAIKYFTDIQNKADMVRIIELDGQAAGLIILHSRNDEKGVIEASVIVDYKCWRQQIAHIGSTLAIREILSLDDFKAINAIRVWIEQNNTASIKLALKQGFRQIREVRVKGDQTYLSYLKYIR